MGAEQDLPPPPYEAVAAGAASAEGDTPCPSCGTAVRDDDKFCGNCAEAMPPPCGKCGSRVGRGGGGKFCGKCGAPAAKTEPE